MPKAKAMSPHKCSFFIFCIFLVDCFALNCRSDGGRSEDELKTIYMNCVKKEEAKNSSNDRGSSQKQDWRESEKQNQGSQWDRRNVRNGNRDDGMGDKDFRNRDDRMSEKRRDEDDNRHGTSGSRGRDDRDNRMAGVGDMMSGRDHLMSRSDDGNKFGRNDFSNDEFGGDMHRFNTYPSNMPSRRFKREKRVNTNSGHRSQYNPNSQRSSSSYDDSDRNETDNNSNKDTDSKACVMHCFLEELEMTGEDGMPDKYLVTHTITKDVKNEDLRDFLQESIEECFQILDNENGEDKCAFSKNLLMCLSEKGRSNCDDWKDDIIKF